MSDPSLYHRSKLFNLATRAACAILISVTPSAVADQIAGRASQPAQARSETSAAHHPLIGINTDIEGTYPKEAKIYSLYYEAIEKSGGIPVLLPPLSPQDTSQALARLDGLMLIGGADYPPSLYGQEPQPKTHIMHEDRSRFDMKLIEQAKALPGLPIFGICAGCQALNIEAKGTLIQDIPSRHPQSKIAHSSPHGWQVGFTRHAISLQPGSKLASIYGTTPPAVPTSHHQCIDRTGTGYTVVARSADGLPEAIESTGERFIIGVQYHPERDYEHNKILFDAFVQQCRTYAGNEEKAGSAMAVHGTADHTH